MTAFLVWWLCCAVLTGAGLLAVGAWEQRQTRRRARAVRPSRVTLTHGGVPQRRPSRDWIICRDCGYTYDVDPSVTPSILRWRPMCWACAGKNHEVSHGTVAA